MIFQKTMNNKFLFIWILWIGLALISSSCEDIEVSYPGNTQDVSPSIPKGNLDWSIDYDEASDVGQLPENLQGTNTLIGVIGMDDNNPDDEIKSVSIQSQKITDNNVNLFILENDSLDQWKLILLSSANIDYETIHGQNNSSTKCDIVLEITDDSPTEEKGILSLAVEITNINEAPEWTNTSVLTGSIDESREFTSDDIYYRDVDIGDNPVLSSSDMPDWLSIETGPTSNNGDRSYFLTGTPSNSDIGSKAFTLKLIDGGDEEITRGFTITVIENEAPYFSGSLTSSFDEGIEGVMNISVTDNNSFDISGLGISIPTDENLSQYDLSLAHTLGQTQAVISGTIPHSYAGETISFRLIVSDDREGNPKSTEENFTITVIENEAPYFSGSLSTEFDEELYETWNISFTDNNQVDRDDLTVTLSLNEQELEEYGLTFQPNNSFARISGRIPTLYAGQTITFDITIADDRSGNPLSTTESIEIVVDPNDAPEFSDNTDPPQSINHGCPYSYQITWSDPDGDDVTLSYQHNVSWLNVNVSNGILSGTPSEGDIGSNGEIILTIKDDRPNASDSTVYSFSISVGENYSPEFTNTDNVDTVAIVGEQYNQDFPVSDQNSDNITFSVPTQPNWLDIDLTTNRVYGTPSLIDIGTDTVIVRAEDNCGAFESFTYTIEISESE